MKEVLIIVVVAFVVGAIVGDVGGDIASLLSGRDTSDREFEVMMEYYESIASVLVVDTVNGVMQCYSHKVSDTINTSEYYGASYIFSGDSTTYSIDDSLDLVFDPDLERWVEMPCTLYAGTYRHWVTDDGTMFWDSYAQGFRVLDTVKGKWVLDKEVRWNY